MNELLEPEAPEFMVRWGDLHDAVVHDVTFSLSGTLASVRLRLEAQDKGADWAWRDLVILVEGLKEFTFRQPPNCYVAIVFEAGIIWDGSTVLLALDAYSASEPKEFREGDLYFGGSRLYFAIS